MNLQPVLTFLLSLLLLMTSSWMMGTFLRLKKATGKYKDGKVFEAACQFSERYVTIGIVMGIVIMSVSFIGLLTASVNLFVTA
jgi:uncharacterized membrane protein YjgN (DUF898 family)